MAEVVQRPRSRWLRWFALGIGLGYFAAYVLDPQLGHSRRTRLADEAAGDMRKGLRWSRRQVRHAVSTAAGRVAAGRPRRREVVDDLTLVDRVQSELFEDPTMPKSSLLFEADRGVVTIRGQVDDVHDITRVGDAVRRIEGVGAVRNLLHVPGTPAPNKQVVLSS